MVMGALVPVGGVMFLHEANLMCPAYQKIKNSMNSL
jgi:hypothetical protein